METFTLPPADTTLMLARQGHAAQSRRRRPALRLSAHSRMSKCVSGSDETVFGDAAPTLSGDDSTQRRHHPASQVRPLSLSATVVGLSVADAGDTAASPGYAPSPCNTLLPSSCPPSARYQLHERFSAELKWDTIEELDGEGGAVFYNGLKRLSLPEAGFVIQGRPRVVNI